MKTNKLILIVIIMYILCMVGAYFGVNWYIKQKDERLYNEIVQSVTKAFGGERETLLDVVYSGHDVSYEQTDFPAPPEISLLDLFEYDDETEEFSIKTEDNEQYNSFVKNSKEWEDLYGDLEKLYRINIDSNDDGWLLVKMTNAHSILEMIYSNDDERVLRNVFSVEGIFPYGVGVKKQEYSWLYSQIPSVKTEIEKTFSLLVEEYSTNNVEARFEKGCFNRIQSEFKKAENDYYIIKKDEEPLLNRRGCPLFGFGEDYDGIDYNTMHLTTVSDGYCRVFIGTVQPLTSSIYRKPSHPEIKEKTCYG